MNSFGEFDVSPFKEIGAALACPRGVSKKLVPFNMLFLFQIHLSLFYFHIRDPDTHPINLYARECLSKTYQLHYFSFRKMQNFE